MRNIEELFSPDRDFLFESIDWLNDNQMVWLEYRDQAQPIQHIKSFQNLKNMQNNDHYQRLAELLAKSLFPLVEDMLWAWIESDNHAYRANAYMILRQSAQADKIDLPRYHKRNLTEFDFDYSPRAFKAAVHYFSEQGERAVLEEALSVHQNYRLGEEYRGQAEFNAGLIEAALLDLK